MTRVYLDPRLLTVAGSSVARGPLAPGIEDAVANLADAGHEVVVLGPMPVTVRGLQTDTSDDATGDGDGNGWLVTTDRAECEGRRRKGLRTVLVGPHEADPALPTLRCDESARDLPGAVLVILAAEAMG